ncbi:MAG TPA: hypothetical protein VFP36_02345, partial [Usitatibacter sp.]|nr:hypothetical protein [Usitatibacter sp.]
HAIRAIARDGTVSTFATLPLLGFAYAGMAMDAEGNLYVSVPSFVGPRVSAPAHFLKVSRDGHVNEIAVTGSSDGTVFLVNLNAAGLAVDRAGNLYIADSTAIRRLSPQGDLTTFAGGSPGSDDGIGTNARFSSLRGLAIDEAGNLFATDVGNHNIRRITLAGVVTTIAGRAGVAGNDDGPAATATFTTPFDIAVGPDGRLYVADLVSHVVRVIGTDGHVATLAGRPGQEGFIAGPLPGSLSGPAGVAVAGREVFVAMGTGVAVVRNVP